METSPPTAASTSELERNETCLGRCVYCEERCCADSTWHQYCRLEYEEDHSIEYEYEEDYSLANIQLMNRTLSHGEMD